MDALSFFLSVIFISYKYRGSVSSWGRTAKHNKEVGGVEGSIHLLWLGVDVVLDEMKKSLEFEKDCDKLGMVALFEGDHYHLQPK